MRIVKEMQKFLGEVDIEEIRFNPKSRDDIDQILLGIQYLYKTTEIREQLFSTLEKLIPENVSLTNGRPGMELWKIFVLGVLRLDLNTDYDRVHNLANYHSKIREMLGHPTWDEYEYELQTIKDNIRLFTPEILDEINRIVVDAGHGLIKKKDNGLRSRCDTFVVETDVHFPTDINLLYDAMRKCIEWIAKICEKHCRSDWRQSHYNLKKIRKSFHCVQRSKIAGTRTFEQKQQKEKRIQEMHKEYIDLCIDYLAKIKLTINDIVGLNLTAIDLAIISNIDSFIRHAERQIDQIRRRVFNREKIPHEEKVFSLFEPHTEWICKGKLGILCELGMRVCVIEDQHGFILHHKIMQKETDDKIAVVIAEETKSRFSNLCSISYDRGFYSKENRTKLQNMLDAVALPKKGKLSEQDKITESDPEYLKAKQKHAAIESAINALEVHGLDRCLDFGLKGFKRYVALAVTARNVQRIGAVLRQRELRLLTLRERRIKKAA